ncbi:methyltransferase domain-containing protein [Marinobacterium sp. YM272]|uniref:class I SAM-dependent DNA methyltransferase n=1 Tax=Marinobacterium sp. YM272 TaxID=3421654 RepID=UPI003D7FB4B1
MLMQQESFTSAQAICRKLLAQKPGDFNARHLLGVIMMRAGNPLSACKELQKAAALPVADRFRAQALSNLSLALQQRDRFDAALEAIEQALALSPAEAAFQINRLYLLEQLEHWPAVIDTLEQTPGLAEVEEIQPLLARAERHTGRTHRALARLEACMANGISDTEILGEYLLLNPEALPAQLESLSEPQLEHLADYLAEEGALERALPLYRRLLELNPANAAARHMVDAAEGRLAEQAPDQYVRELYNTHAEKFEQQLVGRLHYRAPEQLTSALAKHLPDQLGRVADLGCGSGLLGQSLTAGFQIDYLAGCDLSEGMLAQARSKAVYTQLEQANLLHWLQDQQPFELICATDVLIYIGDLGPVMHASHGALLEDGLFAFTVEAADNEALELGKSGRYRHSEAHIKQRASEAGLTVISCTTFPLREEQGKMQQGLMALCRKSCA